MSRQRKSVFLLLLIGLIGISFVLVYYWPKLRSFWENPQRFWELFVNATHLSEVVSKGTLVTVILFFIAAVVDILALGWEKSGLRKLFKGGSRSVWNDITCYLLSVLRVFDVLALVASLGIMYFLASIFDNYLHFSIADHIQNPVLKLILVFVTLDFVHYAQHKFMHYRPFWELHAYHHSAEEFTLLTTSRGHVVEGAIYLLFSGMFYALVGGDDLLEVIFYLNAIREGYQYLLHSDLQWQLGFLGKYILISPAAHRLHHSISEKDYNKNYGTFFIWWDKLFGTYASPTEFYQIGIKQNPYNSTNFLVGQWTGIKRFLGFASQRDQYEK